MRAFLKEMADWSLAILFGAIGILAYLVHWWLYAELWKLVFG